MPQLKEFVSNAITHDLIQSFPLKYSEIGVYFLFLFFVLPAHNQNW